MSLETLINLKALIVGIVLLSLFIIEQIFPESPLTQTLISFRARALRWAKNFGLFAINVLLSPLLVIPLSTLAQDHALTWRGDYTGGWWIIADLLILDCVIYWWHRINHEIPFLWRFHQVHHMDEFLDTSSAVRFHFGEVLLSAVFRMIFIYIFAIDLTSVILFEIAILVSALFHHSNIRLPRRFEKLLDSIIITPAVHWVHHHAKQADTDSNYGTVLSLWDRLFRSRSATVRFKEMPIGIEGVSERPLLRLIIAPFTKTKFRR